MNKLEWGIVALSLVLAGVTVYSFTQITTLQTQVNSLILQINEKDEAINTLKANTLEGKVIKIGYISASTQGLDQAKPFIEQIIEPDMNTYCKQIGKNVTFQFVIEDAQGQAEIHLEKVQQFKNQGISVFIGGGWSSQAGGSYNYVNNNRMLMVSYSSTYPGYAIADDRFIHMCPVDRYITPALVEMMWSYGIRHVVLLQRNDSWGDNTKNLFESAWKAKGGDILGKSIRYATEATEFSSYLTVADKLISDARILYSADTIGGVLLSYNYEAPIIIGQTQDFSSVYSTKWFGLDGLAKSQNIRDQVPEEAEMMKLYSLLPSEPDSTQYRSLESRYSALTGFSLGLYTAYFYDSAMVLMKVMLLADSDKADDIVSLLQPFCDNYFGVSGSCSLNSTGDRLPPPYDIWGYGVVEGKVEFIRYGSVDPVTGSASWDARSR